MALAIQTVGRIALYENENKFRGRLRLRFDNERDAGLMLYVFRKGKKSVQIENGRLYYWIIYETEATFKIMTKVYPWLGETKPKADLIIELARRKLNGQFKSLGKPLPIEEVEYRRGLVRKMKKLNQRDQRN